MIPYGDHAVLFSISGSPRERRALSDALRAVPGVVDVVVAEDAACVLFDGARPSLDVVPKIADVIVTDHVVPALYDGEDLAEVSRATGVDVARIHSSADYEVSFIGFMPGFAYLRGLPESLVLPRRASPRPKVPRGSIAIAAHYSGIYPTESPGGWHLLGRTSRAPAWSIGDRVRFEPASSIEPPEVETRTALALGDTEVRSVQGFAHVVGPPERGRMHVGIPHGGPLVGEAFARLGTRTAIEIFGTVKIGDLVVSSGKDARVAYVGLAIDAPVGSRIVRGDRLSIGDVVLPSPPSAERIAFMPGPDFVPIEGPFKISPTSNRVGIRLDGNVAVPKHGEPSAASRPMVMGAIELTPSGLVVLGPDHPTTGGYPVVGILRERAMDAFYKLPIGASVQFTTE